MTRSGWVIAHTRKYHGLGNRVRVTLGARVLARYEQRRFGYVWPVGTWFGARFDDLWEIDDRVVPAPASRAIALRYPFHDNDVPGWIEAARGQRVWQIRTPHALVLPAGAPSWTSELQSLRPAATVRETVHRFRDRRLGEQPYVGVMVRTHEHSHAETLQASPLEWYVERLTEIRQQRPELGFFVSADTPEGLRRLQDAVPGCVGLTDKGSYNSRQALQSSVADVYLLAGSVHLIAPHYSSFPELAQHLAGPRLRLETSRTGPETTFESGPLTTAADPLRPWERAPLG